MNGLLAICCWQLAVGGFTRWSIMEAGWLLTTQHLAYCLKKPCDGREDRAGEAYAALGVFFAPHFFAAGTDIGFDSHLMCESCNLIPKLCNTYWLNLHELCIVINLV